MRAPPFVRLAATTFALGGWLLACSSSSSSFSPNVREDASGASGVAGDGAPSTAGASSGSAGNGASGGSSGADVGGAGASNGDAGATSGVAGNAGTSNGGTAGLAGNAGAMSSGGAGNGGAGAAGSAGVAGQAGGAGMAGAGGGGVVFPPGCTCMNLGPPVCAPTGDVSYTLAKAANPTMAEQSAYTAITCAMEGAVAYYNCNTSISKKLNVSYVPSVATADGNINGSIRFGNSGDMQCVTAMHEIAHTVGVGTASNWGTYSVGGLFTGTNAIAQLRAITGNATDVLHSDTQHFWPYGLNYVTEAKSTADLIDHCLMVTAIRKDLGL